MKNKFKLIKKLMATAVSALVFSLNAHAIEGESVMPEVRSVTQMSQWRPHVALLIGATQPEGSGITASEVGIDVGYQPYIPFGLSAEFSYARIDDGVDSKDRNTVWAKGTYNFGGTTPVLKDSYIGFGVGSVFKTDATSFAAAPLAGFDIPMYDNLTDQEFVSLGLSTRYAVVSDGDLDTFSLSGVVKYWY